MGASPQLSFVRTDHGFAFWLWISVKLFLGLGQMGEVLFVIYSLCHTGLRGAAYDAFIAVSSLTTVSLLLFRVLGWKPTKH